MPLGLLSFIVTSLSAQAGNHIVIIQKMKTKIYARVKLRLSDAFINKNDSTIAQQISEKFEFTPLEIDSYFDKAL